MHSVSLAYSDRFLNYLINEDFGTRTDMRTKKHGSCHNIDYKIQIIQSFFFCQLYYRSASSSLDKEKFQSVSKFLHNIRIDAGG